MKRWVYLSLLIMLVTVVVFLPVSRNGFVDFDDPAYITDNPHVATGLTGENIKWAFSHAHAHNWHPLTWLSHMVDVELFGLHPAGHHLMSVLIHAISAGLLFLLLFRLTGVYLPAFFVALFFALHPLRVESVAWAAERKDVLATLFFVLSLLAYVNYAKKGKASSYVAALLLHALGLMAKQMGVTLPVILLLLDYWPLKRFRSWDNGKRLFLEKVPFFLLSLGAAITVYLVQKETGVLHGSDLFPLTARIVNALYSYVSYLGKMCWPVNLAVFYPHPLNTLTPMTVLLCALFLMAVTIFALFSGRAYFTFGWLWYLITLLPVLGIIQVGIQGMADRYTYLPSIGIFLSLVYGAWELTEKGKRAKPIFLATGFLLTVILSLLTVRQIGVWQSSVTLYTQAVKATNDNYWAYNNLGAALFAEGKRAEAREMFLKSLSIRPDYPGANKNLAALLFQEGRYREALEHIEKALQVQPNNPEYWTAKGALLLKMNDRKGAIQALRAALHFQPDYPDAIAGLKEIGEKP